MRKKLLVSMFIVAVLAVSMLTGAVYARRGYRRDTRNHTFVDGLAYVYSRRAIRLNFWQVQDSVLISFDRDFRTFVGAGGPWCGATYSPEPGWIISNNILYYNGVGVVQSSGGYARVFGDWYHFKASSAGGDSASEESFVGEWFCLRVDGDDVWLYRSNGYRSKSVNRFWYSLDGGNNWVYFRR